MIALIPDNLKPIGEVCPIGFVWTEADAANLLEIPLKDQQDFSNSRIFLSLASDLAGMIFDAYLEWQEEEGRWKK